MACLVAVSSFTQARTITLDRLKKRKKSRYRLKLVAWCREDGLLQEVTAQLTAEHMTRLASPTIPVALPV